MIIFKENKKNGYSCGINDSGQLFLGNDNNGYCLPDTPENREYILDDFDFYDEREN